MAQSLKGRFKTSLNRLLRPAGLYLARREVVFNMDGVLERAAARGMGLNTWVDVGASNGSWSLQAERYFPNARFLLFEPLAERRYELDILSRRHGFDHVAAAAGASAGMVEFIVDPDLDGSVVAVTGATGTRTVPVETIDNAVATRGLTGPYGIKLDTHGYEVPVLNGAARVLRETELLVIEAYNFTLQPGCLRFHELCSWLETRGFRVCDLADPIRRPIDGVLWQLDLVFTRSVSPWFASNTYD